MCVPGEVLKATRHTLSAVPIEAVFQPMPADIPALVCAWKIQPHTGNHTAPLTASSTFAADYCTTKQREFEEGS